MSDAADATVRTRTGDGLLEPIIQMDGCTVDEFVAQTVNIHFEAMSDNSWWIGVEMRDGTVWHIRCGGKNGRAAGYALVEREA